LEQDLSLLHDKRVIGVNQAYKLGPWVDVCWFGDKQWYNKNIPAINSFGGLMITCAAEAQMSRRWPRVHYVGRSKQYGIETKRNTHIAWNSNSGASAVNVAYWLGAKKVVLLGFDMKLPDTGIQTHWHNDYEPAINRKNKELVDPYPRFMVGWPKIKKDADRIGLEIVNATPNSALDIFPFVDLEKLCSSM